MNSFVLSNNGHFLSLLLMDEILHHNIIMMLDICQQIKLCGSKKRKKLCTKHSFPKNKVYEVLKSSNEFSREIIK